MLLKDVTVKSIFTGKYQKLWEQMGKKFVLKMKNQHNLSDGEVKMLVEMLNDKGVVGQGIDFYKETISNQGVVGGGAKKKSRRRKKKKKAKKTKKRYRRGGSGPDEISPALIILGIISVTVGLFVSWWEDRRHNNPDIANQMDRQQNRRSGRVSAEEDERRHQQRLALVRRGDFTGHQGVTTKSAAHERGT
mgnify:CR=1 FL=1